ncbi:MAG: winged helix-turn-helix domain-containing protein [Chloroflexota bacterium]|nr:winged helix-turn-helix domain-containing protein [Chloroflexota bacterium]
MSLDFLDFELPLLKALIMPGGQARPKDVYPEVETIMNLDSSRAPEEYSTYKGGTVKWKNKTAWAREYLKRKGQIDGSEKGVWKTAEIARDRIRTSVRPGKI